MKFIKLKLSIRASSELGVDGFTRFFFQKYWSIIGSQVTEEVKPVFMTCILPKEWNYTHLCFLPKKGYAHQMSNRRPIILCTVLYKIVSKIVVKRLHPFLGQIVSTNQSDFVVDKLKSYNVLISHELGHGLRTHHAISKEFLPIKTNISKVYDRIEWKYPKALLEALGFHNRWESWIMTCVTSISHSVLIND